MGNAEAAGFSWAIFTTPEKDSGHQIFGDRIDVTSVGLVFYQTFNDVERVVHVQAAGTFHSCEILSAWDGAPTNAAALIDVDS